jgi:gluconolactonase
MRTNKHILLIFFLGPGAVLAQQHTDFLKTHYEAVDLTKENLFTENIEGPDFDAHGNLFVVNFEKNGTIGQVYPDGHVDLYLTLPEGSTANAIKFDGMGNMLLADWTAHNILQVNPVTKAVSVLFHSDQFDQPNDICLSKSGVLYASDPNWKDGTGKVWRITLDGKGTIIESGMGTTNGIELSPDERILYVNESVQRKVWKFDLSSDGGLSNKKLFYEFPDFGLDGMKCDSEGNIYISRHGKGTIAIVSPAGKMTREVALKGKKPSNVVFGGKDGKTCYVTLQDRKCMEMFRCEFPGKKYSR